MRGNGVGTSFRLGLRGIARPLLGTLFCLAELVQSASAQTTEAPAPQFRVSKPAERLDMMVNTSRVLTLENRVPRLFVNDPRVIQATPLSPNQIQVSALRPGLTQLNLWDEHGSIFSVDVIVIRNAAELIDLLRTEFPEATLHVRPLNDNTVYIRGFVPRVGLLDEIISLAKGYYRNVINGIAVGGVQQVALHVKVMEVSRSKLKQLGIDWELFGSNWSLIEGAAGVSAAAGGATPKLPGTAGVDTVRLSGRILGGATDSQLFLQALRQYDLVKLLAEPTLVTMTGRAASFNSGGQIPVFAPAGLGTVGVEYKPYGTSIEFVPIVLGNGMIRLEVRPSVSEVDEARGVDLNGIRVPALTERHADTAVEMRAGQTLALAGLIQNRVESQNRGLPFLGDLPWVGRAFSHVHERVNEVELLIMVTPELIAPLDPHQVPQCGPGQLTKNPCDCELYGYGYLEVPHGCPDGTRPDFRPDVLRTGPANPASAGQTPPQISPGYAWPSQAEPAARSTPATDQAAGPRPAAYPPVRQNSQARADSPRSPTPTVIGPLGYDSLR